MRFLVLGYLCTAKKLFILKDFLVFFSCKISSKKNSINSLDDPSCSIHEFYKGRLQSLMEK